MDFLVSELSKKRLSVSITHFLRLNYNCRIAYKEFGF
jgi:hypothetical protein